MGEDIRKVIAELESFGAHFEDVAKEAAPILAEALQQEFDNGVDPYGAPWADLRPATLAKGRFPPPLTDTYAMRESAEVVAEGASIRMTMQSPAEYHQSGTSKMAARPIFPVAELPGSYQDALREAVLTVFARAAR